MHELEEIRSLAREFAQAELRPGIEGWDRERTLGERTLAQVGELGFFGMLVGDEYGGMGFELPAYVAALEQLAWGEPAVALTVAQSALAATILQRFGKDEVRSTWLEGIARGDAIACLALAEERAGSDLGDVKTRASRAGDAWTIEGTKSWVTNADVAQVALVLASTGAGQFGLFLVPREAGWQAGARAQTLGLRPLSIGELHLRNVRVPGGALLLGPAAAAEVTGAWAELGNLSIAAISLGISQAALDHAIGYADQREQFGRKLREFEGLQFKLAEMATRTEATRTLLQHAAVKGGAQLAAMAKLFGSETAMWVTTQAVQIFGGYGYMRDYPVEKLMRDGKAMELLERANELLRVDIAEGLYQ
jgi:alkylation response protein AidB-like acyl-CoA dehydrogenase